MVEKGSGMVESTWNKWYCFYEETVGDLSISRYMSPTGWQRTAFYFDTKREAQLAFGQHGWKSLPVTTQEISDAKMIRDDCRMMINYDYDREEYLS